MDIFNDKIVHTLDIRINHIFTPADRGVGYVDLMVHSDNDEAMKGMTCQSPWRLETLLVPMLSSRSSHSSP
jgi:hypothetical protein